VHDIIVTGRKLKIGKGCQALNPHLFGPGAALGGVAAREPEPAPAPALDGAATKQEGGQSSLATGRYRVALTVYRKRLMDSHDNLVSSLKPLVDAVAQTLHGGTPGQHDGLVEWEYSQAKTAGAEGVSVRIEHLNA